MKWISVEESLPQDGEIVGAWSEWVNADSRSGFVSRMYLEGRWYDERGHLVMNFNSENEKVTHWFPVEPPEE